jgi:glyoxylate reductase
MAEKNWDIFVTRKIRPEGLDLLQNECRFSVWDGPEDAGPDPKTLLHAVQSCRVLLSLLTETIDQKLLRANPNLLGVANYAVGFNNIDLKTATQLGLPVTHTPGVLTETTADLTWALLMAVARQIPQAHQYMTSERFKLWGPNLFLGADVGLGPCGTPKTLGIVGYGRIGQAVHRRALGFGMKVLAYDPRGKDRIEKAKGVSNCTLNELLEKSDFVTLHCTLNDETHHLIGKAQFARMRKTAYLINTARGSVVDERALVKALREKQIAGAGLDVYEEEPQMAEDLKDLANVVLLPHIASASQETRAQMARMAAQNALALLKKERAPNTVNPEVYETLAYKKRMTKS